MLCEQIELLFEMVGGYGHGVFVRGAEAMVEQYRESCFGGG